MAPGSPGRGELIRFSGCAGDGDRPAMLETHLQEIFTRLNEFHVRYIVVGGVAVAAHGHPRMTADLDLVVALDPA